MSALEKEPDPVIRVSIKTITPAEAAKILARNINNRNPRKTWVAQLSRDMQEGRWQDNGDSIKFFANGDLCDGQHRLMACVASGVPLRTLVITGLAVSAQETLDTGAKRSPADALRLSGWESDTKDVAALARAYVLFKTASKPTHSEIIAWARDNEGAAVAAVHVGRQLRSQGLIGAGVGVYGTAWLELVTVNAKAAGEFFDAFITGADLPKGSPILLLRKHFSAKSFSSTRDRQTVRENVFLIYRAWNAWRKGETLTVFRKLNDGKDPMPR